MTFHNLYVLVLEILRKSMPSFPEPCFPDNIICPLWGTSIFLMGLRWLAEAAMERLTRFGAQRGPRSTTDWHCHYAMPCREMAGWRGQSDHSHCSRLISFRELYNFYFMALVWQMKNQNWSSLRYWAFKQLHPPNGNQWIPTLMEVLVFFMVLITNKSRIRKSLCSGITGNLNSGYLEKFCCQPF